MHLSLLKSGDRFVVWMDRQRVATGETLSEVFGQLSGVLEDAVRDGEPITASWETAWETAPGNRRLYPEPSHDDVEHSRIQLSCFNGALISSVAAAEALR